MCPVCYGDHRLLHLPCGHGMCRSCTKRWFTVSDTCPTCRTRVGVSLVSEGVDRLCRLMRLGYDTTSVFVTDQGVTTLLKKNPPFKCNGAVQPPY